MSMIESGIDQRVLLEDRESICKMRKGTLELGEAVKG